MISIAELCLLRMASLAYTHCALRLVAGMAARSYNRQQSSPGPHAESPELNSRERGSPGPRVERGGGQPTPSTPPLATGLCNNTVQYCTQSLNTSFVCSGCICTHYCSPLPHQTSHVSCPEKWGRDIYIYAYVLTYYFM